MSFRTLVVVSLAALLVVPALAIAQDRPADNAQLVRDKLQADKKLAVAQGLALTQAESTAFWPVYDRYQTDQGRVMDRLLQVIGDYAGAYENMTDSTARRLLESTMGVYRDRQALMESYLPKFRAVLPERKVARYYQIEQKIRAMLDYEIASQIPLIR
ncbi:MAG TPA: hypothetical protein VFO67_09385 [Gemmatimonadales bacterium]|nr:hypothetical protein [Gemmatimonadales bacterium]